MPFRVERRSQYLPHYIVENVLGFHGAIDPDTGHLVCHYYRMAPVTVEVRGTPYPALLVDECIYVVSDPEAVQALIEESTPYNLSKITHEGEAGEVMVEQSLLGMALSVLKEPGMSMEVRRLDGADGSLLVVYRDKAGSVTAVIVGKCESREDKSTILQV